MSSPYLLGAAALAAALFFSSAAEGRVPVAAQALDDDCGAAAVRTILRMAGVEISEKALLAHRPRPQRKGSGLSALDLKQMVAAAALGVELEGTWEAREDLVAAVRKSPVLILLYERGKSTKEGTPGFGHFVVLEAWSQSRGFLVADPAIGRRGFLSLDQVRPKAHGRTRGGRHELLLMRPNRSGRLSARAAPVNLHEERRLRPLDELRRLSTGLSPGKLRVTLGIEAETYGSGAAGADPVDIGLSGQTASLTVEYGLDARTGISWSGGIGRGQAYLNMAALGRFDLGTSVSAAPMQVAVTRRVALGLPENLALDVSVGASFENFAKPIALQGGVSVQAQFGRTGLVGGFDLALVRDRGRADLRLAPSIGVGHEVVRGWNLGGNLSAAGSRHGIEDATLGFSLQTAIGKNWLASLYASRSLYSIDGATTRRIGVALTHVLPNYLH